MRESWYGLDWEIKFYRVDSENHILKNEEYEVKSIDGKSTGLKTYTREDGRINLYIHYPEDQVLVKQYVLNAIPDFLIDEINNINSLSDLQTFANIFGPNSYLETVTMDNEPYAHAQFTLPIRLSATKVEPGYKKKDIIVGSSITVSYILDDNSNFIKKNINITFHNIDMGLIYSDDTLTVNSITDLKNITYSVFNNTDEYMCYNEEFGMVVSGESCIGVFYSDSILPYFVAQKGTVKFSIENTVNGMAKYNASKDRNLEYHINVKNTGNAASSENIITTYVPEEVTLDEDSISNDGVYNESDNSITWEIDYLGIGETVQVRYNATAPSTSNGKELLGHSTIKSGQVESATLSGNTIVTLDRIVEVIDNPDTGMMVYIANTNIGLPISVLIMFVIALLVVMVFLIRKMRYIKRH